MNRKLSTLSAGFAAAVVSAATFAPMTMAYRGQNNDFKFNFEKSQGNVTVAVEDHNYHPDKATLTITPKDDYVCSSVSATYRQNGNKTIEGLSCTNTTFDLPDNSSGGDPTITVNVKFARKTYAIAAESNDEAMGSVAVYAWNNPSRSGEYITVVASPEYNHQFVKWKATGIDVEGKTDTVLRFAMPKNEVSIKAVFEEFAIIEGANQTWTQGSEEGLTIVGNGHFDTFIEATVDSEIEKYTAEEGSTKITLSPEYLNTLSLGEHTFKMEWKNGSAETTFTILAAETEEEPEEETKEEVKEETKTVAPDTGVSSAATLFTAASILTLGGALAAKRANKA